MSERPEPVIGIDLGTSFSVVATLDGGGRPLTIQSRAGELKTPSVVLFEDDAVVVGKEALKLALLAPERVAEAAKRQMGSGLLRAHVAGRRIAPEMVAAFVLKKLKADAEQKVGPIRRAVVTVPDCFDHARRDATARAGQVAGFEAVDILNETTAAALAFGTQNGLLDGSGGLAARPTVRKGVLTAVVYDLGGGTFDAAVVQIRDRSVKTLATDGDVRLGGCDWDRKIIDHAAEQFLAEHPDNDPRKNPETLAALSQAVDEAKRSLSERPKTLLVYTHERTRVSLELSRETFDALTAGLLAQTRAISQRVLDEAGLAWGKVDTLLLVGGSTRMPQVAAMLRELAGKEPDRTLSTDEAVAHGAALYHAILQVKRGEVPVPEGGTAKVGNVNSHSLGVVSLDKSSGRLMNTVLIPRNTPLPHSGSQRFTTLKPNQKKMVVRVVEGEPVDPDECSEIGVCVIAPLPPHLPDRSPIRVRYTYDESGRIGIEATLEDSNTQPGIEIVRGDPEVGQDDQSWAARLLLGSEA